MTLGEQIQYLMEQAEDDCELAREWSAGHPNAAVSRAYYAMFHAAEAILLTKDMKFKKHSAVISAFNRVFCKDWRGAVLHDEMAPEGIHISDAGRLRACAC